MNATIFSALMDPAGAPAHPWIFLILGVVTFALHITAVGLMLGTLAMALRGALTANSFARRLTVPMAFTAKVAVGVAIVLGVAPLLFVQVIYDPFWYTSNVLSAGWTIGFLAILTVGYLALYRFLALNHDAEQPTPRGALWLVAALAVFVVCAGIIHSLSHQALLPHEWMQWYAPDGTIDPSGTKLHNALWPRLAFFLSLAIPVTGCWFYAMRRYLIGAGQTDDSYLNWIEKQAHSWCFVGGCVSLACGLAWMISLPETMQWFATSLWPWLGALAVAFFLVLPCIQHKRRLCPPCNYMATVMSLVVVLIVAALREVLRYGTLARHAGWDALAYKVNFDWPSTVIFFVTFAVVGGLAVAYMLSLAWQAGQTKGQIQVSERVDRLGMCAVLALVVWMAGYFIVGLCTMALSS